MVAVPSIWPVMSNLYPYTISSGLLVESVIVLFWVTSSMVTTLAKSRESEVYHQKTKIMTSSNNIRRINCNVFFTGIPLKIMFNESIRLFRVGVNIKQGLRDCERDACMAVG